MKDFFSGCTNADFNLVISFLRLNKRNLGRIYVIIRLDMKSTVRTSMVTSRVIRNGDLSPEANEWEQFTPEERIEAVWELTLLCLAWRGEQPGEPRLQRSISRVQRPGR